MSRKHHPASATRTGARSPGDELGLLAHFVLEVDPGDGHFPSVRLHHLPVTVMEAADELHQGDGAVLVHVQPVKYPLGLVCGHLQLRADGEELVFLDLPGVIHVVGVKERAQPIPLLCAHARDGRLSPAKTHEGTLMKHSKAEPEPPTSLLFTPTSTNICTAVTHREHSDPF